MKRKPRPDPVTQGSLKEIYEKFFGRLIYYKPDQLKLKDWLEAIFHSKERDVTRYVAKRQFKMPGLYYTSANVKIQGLGQRWVRKDEVVWVRRDITTPDVNDVELVVPTERQFCLSEIELNRIMIHLEESERKPKV